jgi:hypothetical protein
MIRIGTVALGGALALLWAVGLAVDRQAVVLWFDAVAALLSFGVAAIEHEEELGMSRAAGPAIIGLGLAAIWILALAWKQPAWVAWANFVAAGCYLALAAAGAMRARHPAPLAHARAHRSAQWTERWR